MLQLEKKEKYVLITGVGERKGLMMVEENSKKMYGFIVESGLRLVLIDYRNVYFDMTNTDVFNTIRFYESKLSQLKDMAVAVVFNTTNRDLGNLWVDVGNARAFNFRAFNSIEAAEEWLLTLQSHLRTVSSVAPGQSVSSPRQFTSDKLSYLTAGISDVFLF